MPDYVLPSPAISADSLRPRRRPMSAVGGCDLSRSAAKRLCRDKLDRVT